MSWCDAYIPGGGKVGKKEILDTSEPEKFVDNSVKVYKLIDGVKTLIRTEEPFPEGWKDKGQKFNGDFMIDKPKESEDMQSPLKIAVPSREEIETVKKASQNIQDMGRKLHVSASTATKWLKHYNLPTTFRDKYKEAEAEKRQDFTEVETTNFVELHEESGSGKPFSEWIGDPVSLQYGLEQTNPHPTTVPPYKPEDNDNDCEPDGFTEQDDEPIPFVVTTLPEIQPSNYIAEHHQVAEEIAQLLDSKRADYGVENIKKFGSLGCLIRASDKLERLINLRNKEQVNHESIEDTWWDLGGYCILAILELRAGR